MNKQNNEFITKVSNSKVVVVLRNIEYDEIEKFVGLLVEYKFDTLEVTLNSPNPYKSIELISKKFPSANLGAGTVVDKNTIKILSNIGVKFIVSPNTNPQVIEESLKNNLIPIPGFYTATEGFNAIKYGATILKLFPSGVNGINLLKDYSAVFPNHINFIPTGGVNSNNINELLRYSVAVGIGNSLFSKGINLKEFESRIKIIKSSLDI